MEAIRFTADEFVLTVEGHYVPELFRRASRKTPSIRNSTKYLVTGPVGRFDLWCPENQILKTVTPGLSAHPVIFENSDYIFDIEFSSNVKNARIYSRIKEVTERFNRKKRGDILTLTGTINFGNDIGSYDFVLCYEKDGIQKKFCLSFEVYPTKLDYKNDYRQIIIDIEREYTNLVLDFLKKTYYDFKPVSTKGNDLVWWSIFGSIYKNLLHSARFILNKPHSRLISVEENCKADQLKRLTTCLEEQVINNRHIPKKLYHRINKKLLFDTTENRFFKFVINIVSEKFTTIKQFIEEKKQNIISHEFIEELVQIEKELKQIQHNPFFRGVGDYKGVVQESLVLQNRAGYAAIYRNWIMLKRGFKLFDDIRKISLKDMADLYQFWCFLKMKDMIQSILGKAPEEIDLAEVLVHNFLLTLRTGNSSKISFVIGKGEKIELYHDYSYSYKGKSETFSFTVDQRPDIVLKISKSDLKDNYIFTYLFDAKYRLNSDYNLTDLDYPPNDAINQIHRYRDSIYYRDKEQSTVGKEVVGGYILFPGFGTVDEVRRTSFYTSIEDVNIGAFPLVPNDPCDSQQILLNHLAKIIHMRSEIILHNVIPQKGMIYEEIDAFVLAGFLLWDNQIKYFRSGKASIYHFPVYDLKTGGLN
ncbi:MAG TPA: DUF2357 domain-containing protein, partial [Puia sp.]|nr:DUF2357 domain-containing protein [Puia sp.]